METNTPLFKLPEPPLSEFSNEGMDEQATDEQYIATFCNTNIDTLKSGAVATLQKAAD